MDIKKEFLNSYFFEFYLVFRASFTDLSSHELVLFPVIYVKLALCGFSTLMSVHFTNLFVKKSK